MHDLGADAHQELVQPVDVGALARAEAEMMETDAELREALAPERVLALHDADGGASADAVQHAVRVDHRVEAEERQQLRVEGPAGREVAHREERVRDAVDLHDPVS
jgi:hypothetical protein